LTADAIVAQDLNYQYGDLVVVDHISFVVATGEILSFLGPNGAGKTTADKMLTGQIPPKGGTAMLLGLDVTHHKERIQGQIRDVPSDSAAWLR
jgi:ABC-2 type transport system ATP-binding protein